MTLPRSPYLGRGPEMSPGRTTHKVTTQGVLILPPTVSPLTSATFAVFVLISILWNTISPPLNLIFSSSLKRRCLGILTAIFILFPPTISILNFTPKLDVAFMYATTSLALVPTILTLPNFLPSGLDLIVTLPLNISVLFTSHLTLPTILNSLTI